MTDEGSIVASVLIRRDDKFLLVQEKQAHVYGKWNLPGGHVDPGETLEQAAIREAKEETGFDVKIIRPLIVLDRKNNRPVLHSFEAEIVGGDLNFPKDEIIDAKWYTHQQTLALTTELRSSDYVINSIEKAQN